MEQVKIFTAGTVNEFDGLERDVNDWLSQNKKIKVVSRNVASTAGTNSIGENFVNCTIVIFYRT